MRPMLPSWMRSRNCSPRFVYFLAMEMTRRRFASTISFFACAALTWPCRMMVITRLISSALALARCSASLISCCATQICCALGDWNFLAALRWRSRSEEHTSELQSQSNLVCRLLLEKKKKKKQIYRNHVPNSVLEVHVHYLHTQ